MGPGTQQNDRMGSARAAGGEAVPSRLSSSNRGCAIDDPGLLALALASFHSLGQGRPIQDSRRFVAHFLHNASYAAGLFVRTFVASSISRLADTGKKRQRPVQDANHFSDRSCLRSPVEEIASAFTFLAL